RPVRVTAFVRIACAIRCRAPIGPAEIVWGAALVGFAYTFICPLIRLGTELIRLGAFSYNPVSLAAVVASSPNGRAAVPSPTCVRRDGINRFERFPTLRSGIRADWCLLGAGGVTECD